MTISQQAVLKYYEAMRVGAMFLNTSTYRQWIWADDIRKDAVLARDMFDAILTGPWQAQLTEPINESDKLGWSL